MDLSPDPVSGTASILTQADFSDSILDGADLTGVVGGCEDAATAFDCTTFARASLVGAVLIDAQLALSSFDSADLTDAVLEGADLSEAVFTQATLFNALLAGAVLTSAVLTDADLTDANLSSADLRAADLTGATAVAVDLDSAILTDSVWESVDATGAFLGFAEGSGADFTDAILADAVLDFADLTGTILAGADLSGAFGFAANLASSDLSGADLTGAIFDSAELQDTTWIDAIFHDADFSFADLSGMDARCGDSVAVPPVEPPSPASCSEFNGAILRGADLVDGSLQYAQLVASATAIVDLAEANLTRADFSDACFTALSTGVCQTVPQLPPTSLVDALLSGSRFDRAIMAGVDLRFADGSCVGAASGDPDQSTRCPSFVSTNLAGADLRQVQINGGVFTATNLTGVDLTGAFLDGMKTPCTTPASALELPSCVDFGQPGPLAILLDVRFQDADVAGVDFGGLEMTRTDFTEADAYKSIPLVDTNGDPYTVEYTTSFAGAMLVEATFASADLTKADFAGADLTAVDFTSATLTDTDFTLVEKLAGADFDSVILTCSVAGPCDRLQMATDLRGASFVGANLTSLVLSNKNLDDVDFTSAILTGANLSGAAALRADFASANLGDAVFATADLTDANFDSAILTGADLSEISSAVRARFDSTDLRCPVAGPCIRFPVTDLSGTSFVGANLTSIVLAGRNLTDADFTSAILTGADLQGALAIDADFSSATLANVLFGAANLTRADFETANLAGADFSLVTALAGARFDSVDLSCTVPGTCDRFPVANLVGASFVGANLSSLILSDLDLSAADFSGAVLNATDLSGATLDGANFTSAFVTSTVLSGASLIGADFTTSNSGSAVLTGANLTGAVLTGGSFASANFTSSDLLGADLSQASFFGATFSEAGVTVIDAGNGFCTLGAGETVVDLRGASLVGTNLGSAVNFQEGCILVDAATTYDDATTVFPAGFTLAGQMTDVPEPAVGLAQIVAIGMIGLLARRRSISRGSMDRRRSTSFGIDPSASPTRAISI